MFQNNVEINQPNQCLKWCYFLAAIGTLFVFVLLFLNEVEMRPDLFLTVQSIFIKNKLFDYMYIIYSFYFNQRIESSYV